ncbi:MAG: T9SS type A sorting domain-containing protein [Bacteroidales bacterium]|nr:T9SS type A sorting domain-containing protein [Bacteroidales bacterium]
MKNIFTIILILVSNMVFSQESQTKSVLFLGNSYTSYNGGVDQVLKQIATSKGDVVEALSSTPGGSTFSNHCTNATSLNYIKNREWDYVVLQEQSLLPSFPPAQVEAESYPYAEILCDSIKSNSVCTTPVFFMTWGRENGDAGNCEIYSPLCTYEGMQWRLRQSYVEMAELNGGIISPVGMVWKSVRDNHPEIDLYQSDESHPSNNGTYLAACTFYATLFNKSPEGADYPATVTPETAAILQTAAWAVVNDSIDTWLIDTTTLRVDFQLLQLTKNVNAYFNNFSENTDSCYWEFGDGESQWQYPPFDMALEHAYPEVGIYDVCLTGYGYNGCKSKTTCKTEYISVTGYDNYIAKSSNVFPNPVTAGIVQLSNHKEQYYSLYSADGKMIKQAVIINNAIDVSDLNAGVYILIIGDKTYKIVI